jgi:NADH:ubiquinone oxidoreductase subunit 6 (subunit J)
MWEILLGLLALGCGVMALQAQRLLAAALWLAGVSAAVATLMYSLGAYEVAVIELSVGAGLVTVLFVFAIALAGEEAMSARLIVPRLLVLLLVIGLFAVLGLGFSEQLAISSEQLPTANGQQPTANDFATTLWQERGLDMLVQVGLIFAGVMGVLGLLAEQKQPVREPETAREQQGKREILGTQGNS